MRRIALILGALFAAATIAACGETAPPPTIQQACASVGSAYSTAPVYQDDEGQESRCDNGAEVENEGYGWYADEGATVVAPDDEDAAPVSDDVEAEEFEADDDDSSSSKPRKRRR